MDFPMLSEHDRIDFDEKFRQHWDLFAQSIQLNNAATEYIFSILYRVYTESQRAYHTIQHIVECLDLFKEIQDFTTDPRAIELAIWFHDVVYDPKSNANEYESAVLMQHLMSAYLNESTLEKTYQWILATQTHQACSDQDLKYLLDIDLSILGSSKARFQQYEKQIQFEYAWVDSSIYRSKRSEVLKGFLSMQPIFQTDYFQSKFEQQARLNLSETTSCN